MSRNAKAGDGAGRRPAPSTLSDDEQRELCREAALRVISFHERSTSELRSRLMQKGFSSWIVAEMVARLVETGLVSDERFASQFASSAAGRGASPARIRGELLRRGIEKEPAAQAATASPEEEGARALEVARRRARQLGGLSPEVRTRRLTGFLARRGYRGELVRRVVEEALGELDRRR